MLESQIERLEEAAATLRSEDLPADRAAALIEECARIDGATRFGAMVRIIFPIAVPGILSAGIFAFTLSWNEFIYALVFLSSPEKKTVPVGVVSELIRGDIYFWGQLMAGALLGSIPVALVYSFFVEYYVSGLTGSVKG